MKNLQFDFLVNKETKKINVLREFAADLTTVWNCWTIAELLDQWWAPKPYSNQTIHMNFTEGNAWFYCMISPKEEKHYCTAKYKKIKTQENFSYRDAFCNEREEEIKEI